MSVYKEFSMAAAFTATAAAFMIRSPWAFYVATGIGTMISDPEGMEESAKQWRTSDRGGLTDELDELDTQLAGLRTQLQEKGTWEGESFKAFDAVHTSYKDSLKQLKEVRNSTGDGVESTAGFYKVSVYACNAIALGMMAFGIWKLVSKANPVTAAVAEGSDPVVGRTFLTAAKQVLRKQVMVAGGLTFALYSAVQASEMSGKIFPSLKAIPTEMSSLQSGKGMPFTQDGMTYDENAGSLMPKMDESANPYGGGSFGT
ncbi:WXG100 family type VII secretion target [Actinomadura sp. ATCC 31491]|uniref:WXG100 family type VII secretion target n=1 Tax=Actinomadura luzonensis TaxID=2805427 RepID=A0ABT0G9L4_9ACTN|nr:WXG100 family type VII secretion target [Actinomadura luzonensis]MCK2221289.1 WXG100 family type VII secretion target [Actinomadura luzonensis]